MIDAFSEGANLGSSFMFTMPMALPDDEGMIVEEVKDEATAHWHSLSIGEMLDQSADASNTPVKKPEASKPNLDIFLEESKIDDSQLPQSYSLALDESGHEMQLAMVSEKVQMQDDDSDLSIDFQDFFPSKRKPQKGGQRRSDVESRVGMKFISKQKANKLEGQDIQDQLLIAREDHNYDADSDSLHGRGRGAAQGDKHRGETVREKDAEILVVEDNLFCSYALISIL